MMHGQQNVKFVPVKYGYEEYKHCNFKTYSHL